ncbi:A/G-specific adenine glycosylase [Sphingobacterium rhinopitheci]|uniref:A/G-specific adenine glycosylase n=1 Tax=Sphingobacterium rhinopitheci TaxID=2781960 RepID=UPI001F515CE0|nr:A/G-specific adenine glycosylase [Sphingobacterium rhinopitheci]MCI0920522.1 A/G-specific adenine glycosylase [Sphingobacterium rhinopitheci]
MSLAQKLIDWYSEHGRDLPWRNTNNPYIIWLSEIILQQTRVEQGLPYFYRFVDAFPTVSSFAAAQEEEILRLWQGLGYYSRARNMHKAAKLVMQLFDGVFPTAYEDVIKLPGVGDYTAAAVSSFSVNENRAVLDGNVFRVLSRYYGIDVPINTGQGKKIFHAVAQDILPKDQAAIYNQAIMDFGATVCKPKAAFCEACVLRLECVASRENSVSLLPVKIKGKGSRNRYFHYFVIQEGDSIVMNKRGESDVWANLYEFPLIETSTDSSLEELVMSPEYQQYFGSVLLEPVGEQVKHILSHQNIHAKFYRITEPHLIIQKKEGWNYHLLEKLDKLAKHKLIFSFINKYMLTN